MAEGHRSSRREASLRAARRNATLWRGEDSSGQLCIRNDPKPKAAIRDNTHKWRGCPQGSWLSTAQLRPIAQAIRVLARANGSSSCPKQRTRKELLRQSA